MMEDHAERRSRMPEPETIILEAPDLASARSRAASLWGIKEEDLIEDVLEDSKRLFGLLGKKVTVKITSSRPLMYLQARDFVRELMVACGLDLSVDLDESNGIVIDGEDSGILIGRYGDTLKAYEFLTNLMFRLDQSCPKIKFDCGGYKDRKEERLIRLAESAAEKAIAKGASIRLKPMSSWERRVIHMALQSNSGVETLSEGVEPARFVVITPSSGAEHRRRPRGRRRA